MDAALLPALEDVVMVARTGSVAGAAARLHKTPSAVSQQVRRVEGHFGVELFERHGRGVRLSRAGDAALSAVNRLFDEAKSVFDLLSSLAGETATTVRIATSDYLGNALLVPVLRDLIAQGAPLRFEIVSSNSFDSARLVERGEVDLAVITTLGSPRRGTPLGNPRRGTTVASPARTPTESLDQRALFVQPFFWVAPRKAGGSSPPGARPSDPGRGRLRDRLAELLHTEPLLRLSPGSQGRRLLDGFVERAGLRAVSTIDLSGVDLLVSYVRGGVGLGLAPGLALLDVDRRRIIVDRADIEPLPVVLVSRPRFQPTPGVARFVEHLVAQGARIERRMSEALDPSTQKARSKAPSRRRATPPRRTRV